MQKNVCFPEVEYKRMFVLYVVNDPNFQVFCKDQRPVNFLYGENKGATIKEKHFLKVIVCRCAEINVRGAHYAFLFFSIGNKKHRSLHRVAICPGTAHTHPKVVSKN